MKNHFFRQIRAFLLVISAGLATAPVVAAPQHGLAMYGEPALPQDMVSLPYANPNAPVGGVYSEGNTGGFDSLNPFILKGTAPWQLRSLAYESLMLRSWDEPFTLYCLLCESVEVPENRSWIEFTLRPEARFSDGSPVTVEDVLWSFETLGREGHPRYLGFQKQVASMEATGPRSLRITFNTEDRELALLAGLRPILKKAQWEGKSFSESTLQDIPVGTAPYVVHTFEQGRFVSLKRNPEYWGAKLPLRAGTANLDEIRLEFFGDRSVMFEAFKAGALSIMREDNAEDWERNFDFPAVTEGRVVKAEIPHQRPTGMTGFVMNTRRALFADWRVREAMLLSFNFPYINGTVTGGRQPRIRSYFDNSALAGGEGPASDAVRELLTPFAASLPPGVLDGYILPQGDEAERNRKDLRAAMNLLAQAGWKVQDGSLVNESGAPFAFEVLVRQGDSANIAILGIWRASLDRLGIQMVISPVDNAQFAEREARADFDITVFRRDLSLSPGNEQKLYWGSAAAEQQGSRNLMGAKEPAIDAMIAAMLSATDPEAFKSAAQALDRVLMAGRYVIPIWTTRFDRIAHDARLKYPSHVPIYGDRIGWLPDVWWFEERN